MDKVKKIIAYTDGSSTVIKDSNGNREGGIGIYIPVLKIAYHKNYAGSYVTNQVMELKAAIKAIKKCAFSSKKYWDLIIYSDSMYVVDIVNKYGLRWLQANWPKKIKNIELVKKLYTLSKLYNVTFVHINSHTKQPDKTSNEYEHWFGNHKADALAKFIK